MKIESQRIKSMKITEIKENKKRYLDLLLLADEQESIIDKYIDRGELYLFEDGGVKALCVVTDEGKGVLVIKSIAVYPEFHGRGYGRMLIEYIESEYAGEFSVLRVGTGDSETTIPFYKKCGFEEVYRIKDFFTNNYDLPIYENGVLLEDMVYLEKKI
ncbi:GNAT family N-acetyltransferase [Microaceticoccus formicicus]|uniref:GNAT family N-acetyltransferase n=1 Tax=Microaceticoccus formicicus TaxID=3118105 RepID=UPI003CD03A8A|nr:GNAT family N-acetyltransferase [Peptoniphilaceae bacterium AMB_02]